MIQPRCLAWDAWQMRLMVTLSTPKRKMGVLSKCWRCLSYTGSVWRGRNVLASFVLKWNTWPLSTEPLLWFTRHWFLMRCSLSPELGNRSTCSRAPECATGALREGTVRGHATLERAVLPLSAGQEVDQLKPWCQGTFCSGCVDVKIPRKRKKRCGGSWSKSYQVCTRHLALSCYKKENNCESREKSAAARGYSYHKRSHQALFIVAVLANYFLITHHLLTSVPG